MKKDTKITVRVTGQVREVLEQLAAADASSVSWQIQRAIAAYLSARTSRDADEDRR